ncbi:hypothetical protein FDECE_4454 [Fusarium decemcellulare]|nr:hypothetical protein FDECE_4454 [Fusarium decemcellulare]
MTRPLSNQPERHDPESESSDETPLLQGQISPSPPTEPQAVSWASIPRKGQLASIVFARLAEPLSERSLTSYLFYQLRWFDPSLDAADIAKQAGYLTAVFAAAQCLTSVWWGHAADNPCLGRKRVLVIGLCGSALSALGMGFSKSLSAAFFFRFLAGALNGNVGVLRTMVSEVVADRRYQSRAFLLLPMCFNVGVIIGPLLSGFLADPIHSLPGLVGPGSPLGGARGVQWLKSFPYALPNLLCSTILSIAALGIVLGLDETHPQLRHQPDPGRRLGKLMVRKLLRRKAFEYPYEPICNSAPSTSLEELPDNETGEPVVSKSEDIVRASLRSVLTRNVCMNMAQRFLQSLHVSAFNSIFFSLLPAPKAEDKNFHLPFRFTGGLGLSSEKMGFANTTIGMIGIPLQLLLYPKLIGSLGVRNSYRIFLPLSILAYFSLPYLVLLPDDTVLIWTCLSAVLTMHVMSRTFVNPATMIARPSVEYIECWTDHGADDGWFGARLGPRS